MPIGEAVRHAHNVLNLFMCTGFAKETGQYFMKASPVRPRDYLELFAEIDFAREKTCGESKLDMNMRSARYVAAKLFPARLGGGRRRLGPLGIHFRFVSAVAARI